MSPYVGTELITNRQLSDAERVQKAIVGSVQVGITGATICSLPGVPKRGVPKAPAGRGPVHLDIGGEGRYPGAINVNPNTTTSTAGTAGRPIPNLVQATGE